MRFVPGAYASPAIRCTQYVPAVTDLPSTPRSVPSQMGAHMRRRGDGVDCWVQVSPDVCSHGIVRGCVLVMMVDVGAGWAAEQCADDDWTFTVDIGIRRHPAVTDRIEGAPTVQRAGRTISIDLPMTDSNGAATATGVSTFIRLPRRAQDPPRPDYPEDSMEQWQPPDAPLHELLAPTTTEAGLMVDIRPELLNPAGILQGGVAALLAELAAQRRLESTSGQDLVVTSFDVRYVTMGRIGPFEAEVEPIGPEMAVVKLRDRGADDAVVTHNLIGFAPV
jgi:acyl-coenzyme A thioesterase PaaI-like protein